MIIELAAVAVGGYVGGLLSRRRKPKIPPPPTPICGCTHHYAVHDKDGCHSSVQVLVERGQPTTVRTGYGGDMRKVVYNHERWEQRKCACRQYTGPEPLPEYYHPGTL